MKRVLFAPEFCAAAEKNTSKVFPAPTTIGTDKRMADAPPTVTSVVTSALSV
jgi:hypothetical protein